MQKTIFRTFRTRLRPGMTTITALVCALAVANSGWAAQAMNPETNRLSAKDWSYSPGGNFGESADHRSGYRDKQLLIPKDYRDPTTGKIHDCAGRRMLYRTHVDAAYVTRTAGKLNTMVIDGNAVSPAEEVCMRLASDGFKIGTDVVDAARLVIPNDPRLSFLGKPGQIVWHSPQVYYQGHVPVWAGLGAFEGNHEKNPPNNIRSRNVTVHLSAYDGPGYLEVFSVDAAMEANRMLSTREKILDYSVLAGSHGHFSWVFSHPGTYHLTFQASVEWVEANGTVRPETSSPITITWLVGPNDQVGLPADASPWTTPFDVTPEQQRDQAQLPTVKPDTVYKPHSGDFSKILDAFGKVKPDQDQTGKDQPGDGENLDANGWEDPSNSKDPSISGGFDTAGVCHAPANSPLSAPRQTVAQLREDLQDVMADLNDPQIPPELEENREAATYNPVIMAEELTAEDKTMAVETENETETAKADSDTVETVAGDGIISGDNQEVHVTGGDLVLNVVRENDTTKAGETAAASGWELRQDGKAVSLKNKTVWVEIPDGALQRLTRPQNDAVKGSAQGWVWALRPDQESGLRLGIDTTSASFAGLEGLTEWILEVPGTDRDPYRFKIGNFVGTQWPAGMDSTNTAWASGFLAEKTAEKFYDAVFSHPGIYYDYAFRFFHTLTGSANPTPVSFPIHFVVGNEAINALRYLHGITETLPVRGLWMCSPPEADVTEDSGNPDEGGAETDPDAKEENDQSANPEAPSEDLTPGTPPAEKPAPRPRPKKPGFKKPKTPKWPLETNPGGEGAPQGPISAEKPTVPQVKSPGLGSGKSRTEMDDSGSHDWEDLSEFLIQRLLSTGGTTGKTEVTVANPSPQSQPVVATKRVGIPSLPSGGDNTGNNTGAAEISGAGQDSSGLNLAAPVPDYRPENVDIATAVTAEKGASPGIVQLAMVALGGAFAASGVIACAAAWRRLQKFSPRRVNNDSRE